MKSNSSSSSSTAKQAAANKATPKKATFILGADFSMEIDGVVTKGSYKFALTIDASNVGEFLQQTAGEIAKMASRVAKK